MLVVFSRRSTMLIPKDAPMRIQPDYSDSQTSSPDSFYAHPDYPMDGVSAINLQFSTVERFASPEDKQVSAGDGAEGERK